jgi:hypothetical protein
MEKHLEKPCQMAPNPRVCLQNVKPREGSFNSLR